MKKNLKIIFGISLVLNLVLIGFIAGKVSSTKFSMKKAHHFKKHLALQEEKLIAVLPSQKQDAAKEVLAKMHKIRENNRWQDKAIIAEIEQNVMSEKFDEQQFLQSFKKLSDAMVSTKNQCDIEVAKFLSTLNQKERSSLLKQLKLMHPPFGNKFERHEDKGQKDHKDHE